MKMNGSKLNGIDLSQNDVTGAVPRIALDGHILKPGTFRMFRGILVQRATRLGGCETREIIVIGNDVIMMGSEVCETGKNGNVVISNYRRFTPCEHHDHMKPVMRARKRRDGGGLYESHRVCDVCGYSTESMNKPPKPIIK